METKKLDNNQLEHFNTDLMQDSYWEVFLKELVDKIDISKPFKLLDIGGGNGRFADKLIELYPNIEVTILDNSDYLLAQNTPNPRKHLICGSVIDIDNFVCSMNYDIITINWVLHHLIGNTRKDSLKIMSSTLSSLTKYLSPNGRISIIENLYCGLIWDSFPSRLIYFVTSIHNSIISSLVKRIGFNTAGVGVCFLSEKIIKDMVIEIGLKLISTTVIDQWNYNILSRLILHTHPMIMRNLWITKG
ncbi:MAG: methyltransferase [Muribaculaceae bacterium]